MRSRVFASRLAPARYWSRYSEADVLEEHQALSSEKREGTRTLVERAAKLVELAEELEG